MPSRDAYPIYNVGPDGRQIMQNGPNEPWVYENGQPVTVASPTPAPAPVAAPAAIPTYNAAPLPAPAPAQVAYVPPDTSMTPDERERAETAPPPPPPAINPGGNYGYTTVGNDPNEMDNYNRMVSQYGATPLGTLGADTSQMYVTGPDGQTYMRVGGMDVSQVMNAFPDTTKYDPTYGYITPAEPWLKYMEEHKGSNAFFDKILPGLIKAGVLAAPALFGGLGALGAELGITGGGGAAGTAATGAEPFVGSMDLLGGVGTPLGDLAAASAPGAGVTGGLSTLLETPTAPTSVLGGGSGAEALGEVAPGGAMDMTGSTGTGIPGSGPATSNAAGGLAGTLAGTAAGAAQGAGSAISRILDGTASAADWASVLGTVGQSALGIGAGLQGANATENLGERILNMGAPSLARYEASFAPGFDLFGQEGAYKNALDSSWDSALRKLSATGGNPFGNPGGLIEANKNITSSLGLPALQNYREINRAAGFGNVPQYAQLASNAIGQQGGAWEAAGAGLESLLNPRRNYTLNLGDTLG